MKANQTNKPRAAALALGIVCGIAAGPVSAGEPMAAPSGAKNPVPVEEPKDCCDYWRIPPLYKSEGNPFLQELSIGGRYQGQYYAVDSDKGSNEDWDNRRWRIGGKAKLFNFLELAGDININDEFDPFYDSIEEVHLTAKFDESFNLMVGKFKPKWSYEWSTSSREILPFERGLLVNQVRPEKSSGVGAYGKIGKWNYNAGIFSGDFGDEFGDFDGGAFGLASIGYDFKETTGLDRTDWRFDYIYNSDDENNGGPPYDHSFASHVALAQGDWGLVTEVMYAAGDDDAWGFYTMPTYFLTKKLQLVGRYQYAHGDNDSLRLQSRYERTVPDLTDGGHGEEYNAFYLGLNYYICEHRLKLMSGVEYSTMDDAAGDGGDFSGWTWFNGIRLYF